MESDEKIQMIALAFFAGILLTATIAILIVRGANPPRGYQPLPSTKLPPPPVPRFKPAREADFWDIANHEPEASRVEYRFLDIPYEDEA